MIFRRRRRRYEQAKLDLWTEGIRAVSNAEAWHPSPATIDWTRLRGQTLDVLIWDDNYFDTDRTRAEPTPIFDQLVDDTWPLFMVTLDPDSAYPIVRKAPVA